MPPVVPELFSSKRISGGDAAHTLPMSQDDAPGRGFAEQPGVPTHNEQVGTPFSSGDFAAKGDELSSEELASDIATIGANMTMSELLPRTALSADTQESASLDHHRVHSAGPEGDSHSFPTQAQAIVRDGNESSWLRIKQKVGSSRYNAASTMTTNLDAGAVLGAKRAKSGTSELDADDLAFRDEKSTGVPYSGVYPLQIPYTAVDDERVGAQEISFRAVVTSDVCFAVQSQCTLPLNCTTKIFRTSMPMIIYRVPRPSTTVGDDPPETFLCASNQTKPIATISYFRELQPANPSKVTRIRVRTFLNPGYDEEISFRCGNCTKYHVLAIRMIPLNCLATIPRNPKAGNLRGSSSTSIEDCSQVDPCQFDHWADGTATFDTFSDPVLSLNGTRIVYHLKNPNRVSPLKRRKWFHHHAALCMYENYGARSGDFVGFLDIHMDGADVQAFVCFVCFFGVALPLLCMMTLLLHANKQRRCKMRVQVVRLRHQRIQLEEELLTHNGDDEQNENQNQDGEAPE